MLIMPELQWNFAPLSKLALMWLWKILIETSRKVEVPLGLCNCAKCWKMGEKLSLNIQLVCLSETAHSLHCELWKAMNEWPFENSGWNSKHCHYYCFWHTNIYVCFRKRGRNCEDKCSTKPLLECMCKNAIFSGDHLNGFRCCLLRCLAVSKSQVQECGDLWSSRFSPLIKDSWDAIISATINIYVYQSAVSKPSFVSLIPRISFMLQIM